MTIRFKISAEHLLPSLYETLDELAEERQKTWEDLLRAQEELHESWLTPYQKPESITWPVPYQTQRNPNLHWAYEQAYMRYEAANQEYFEYLRYVEFITSEDRELEIKPETTVFFMPIEEFEELTRVDNDLVESKDDIFAQAERRQIELLATIEEEDSDYLGDEDGWG